MDLTALTELLERHGFIAAEEEARELLAYAAAATDAARLATLASAARGGGASLPGALRPADPAARLAAAVEHRLTYSD